MNGGDFLREYSSKPPFSRMHPLIAAFFRDYLSNEKIIKFKDFFVLNTHFPPYPSKAFDNLVEHFNTIGDTRERRLYSVTLAGTNRCNYNCWHCYNAGRSNKDIPLSEMKKLAAQIQDMNAVMVTLTGGEPLLRDDLEKIIGLFDDRVCLILNTTGDTLTLKRAKEFKKRGLFALGVSLDSTNPEEHDRMRGRPGAFNTALRSLKIAEEAGLYPYIITVAHSDLLIRRRFMELMKFAAGIGALEVHLLEPCAVGKLSGRKDVLLTPKERQIILDYQAQISRDEKLPILSTFLYLESSEAFGCGAGITHLYIDGAGEVSPCNLVPLSFGNIKEESLKEILSKMGKHFCRPRTGCVGKILSKYTISKILPVPFQESNEICKKYLPSKHPVPKFFRLQEQAVGSVGREELKEAYNEIHEFYEDFWLSEAGGPILDLIKKIAFKDKKRIFEAGCGTGFATVLLADKIKNDGAVVAADISRGMLIEADKRARSKNLGNINFVCGDALVILDKEKPFDLVFSSWVLGYIPLKPFFKAVSESLTKRGGLGFVVHKENSPREPMEIFGEIIAENPSVLLKQVKFDFPRDIAHIENEIKSAGMKIKKIWDGKIVFRYDSAEKVLEHLLKSGAGTAFYNAIDPQKRSSIEKKFLKKLSALHKAGGDFEVVHDYISCIALKP